MKKKTILSFHVQQGAACLFALFSARGLSVRLLPNGGVRLTSLERIGLPCDSLENGSAGKTLHRATVESAACCDLLFSRRPTVMPD